MRRIPSIRLRRIPTQRILLLLWSLKEGSAFRECGGDGGVLDAVVGEVYKAGGLEGVEDGFCGGGFGGGGAGQEG